MIEIRDVSLLFSDVEFKKYVRRLLCQNQARQDIYRLKSFSFQSLNEAHTVEKMNIIRRLSIELQTVLSHDVGSLNIAADNSLASSPDLIVDFPQGARVKSGASDMCKPRVSFADDVDIHFVESLPAEYKDDMWFTRQEIRSFKNRTARLLKCLECANMTVAQYAELNSQETSAFLGLEGYLSENTAREIRCRRMTICRAVLLEQLRQFDAGIFDPESIANIAMQISEISKMRAQIIGLLHAGPETEMGPLLF